jgi:hypothetical protein
MEPSAALTPAEEGGFIALNPRGILSISAEDGAHRDAD